MCLVGSDAVTLVDNLIRPFSHSRLMKEGTYKFVPGMSLPCKEISNNYIRILKYFYGR